MRETLISNCEKSFIEKIVATGSRLDGRNFHESRKLSINFGSEWGSCLVSLGETKVLSQVTCEVVQPKMIRPNEGVLFINVEIGPMASPQFEQNRQTDLTVYLNRILEKCYKDSKCIDLESLCIVVEEKVWSLRVDLRVLNHGGNLLECCSVACLASLAHFKRPDVTRSGENVIIHTIAEKDPIPTVLYHYPVCVGFAIMTKEIIVADPSYLEEAVCMSSTEEGAAGGLLVIGMNQYREVCLMDLSGAALSNRNVVHKAISQAAIRCKDYVDLIKQSIVDDDNLRKKRQRINFSSVITTDHKMALVAKDISICLAKYKSETDTKLMETSEDSCKEDEESLSKYNVTASRPNTAIVNVKDESKKSGWIEISSDSE